MAYYRIDVAPCMSSGGDADVVGLPIPFAQMSLAIRSTTPDAIAVIALCDMDLMEDGGADRLEAKPRPCPLFLTLVTLVFLSQ